MNPTLYLSPALRALKLVPPWLIAAGVLVADWQSRASLASTAKKAAMQRPRPASTAPLPRRSRRWNDA